MAKQVIAQELIERARKLQSDEVEVGVPKEIVEEAGASSSMAEDPGGDAFVQRQRERQYEADENR
eukprot:446191-Karenia_brevis.AAC.1